MADAFAKRAEAAYEAEGGSREEDSPRGLLVQECFVLDPEAATAVGDAAGAEGPAFRIAETNYLSGVPGEDEILSCSLSSSGAQIAVIAGTTLVDAEGQLERIQRGSEGLEEIDGDAPGLDAADVVAASGEGVARLAWVSDGFVVGITGPEDLMGGEEGFAALSAAVEGVERTLSG
jgi:hypothetical protein